MKPLEIKCNSLTCTSINILCHVGDAEVDIFGEPTEESLIKANPTVEKGGKWKPKDCQAWQRVAIIIPYRDRLHHLHILLRRLHPMLQTQKIDYRIFLIEQVCSFCCNYLYTFFVLIIMFGVSHL